MSSERDNRQRAARRAKLEREMAARQEAARRKRLLQARIGATVAGLVVLGAIAWIVIAAVSKPATTSTPSAGGCVYTPVPQQQAASPTPSGSATPSPTPSIGVPAADQPRTGYQVITYNTNRGVIKVEMDLSKTPCTAASMANLIKAKFYDGTSCHRLVTDIFALQCGDPTGTGSGGPGYQFADENLPVNKLPAYHAGDVAMANAGAGTNGSQFFFVWSNNELQGQYSLWGHIIEGLDIIKAVGAGGDDGAFAQDAGGGHPKLPLTFKSVTIGPVSPTSQVKPTTPAPTSAAPSATSASPSAAAS